jgi:hypothetical protein
VKAYAQDVDEDEASSSITAATTIAEEELPIIVFFWLQLCMERQPSMGTLTTHKDKAQ